jgi:hypothetical protein
MGELDHTRLFLEAPAHARGFLLRSLINRDDRFSPKADKLADVSLSPLRATSCREQMQQGSLLFRHFAFVPPAVDYVSGRSGQC